MRASLCSATLVATLLALVAGSTQVYGQAGGAAPRGNPGLPATPAAAPPGTNVAVVDIGFVFKNHNNFLNAMEDVRRQFEEFEGQLKVKEQTFMQKREALGELKSGTLEYKKAEEEIARMGADAQIEARSKQKELMEQEAKIYFTIYSDLEKRIENISRANQIGLVLRFSKDEMKADDRQSVMQGLSKSVVWHNPNLDLTEMLINDVNRGTKAPPNKDKILGTGGSPLAQPKQPMNGPAGTMARPPNSQLKSFK